MKKLADFLVNKRLILFFCSLAAAAACIFLMQRVTINEDLTKYLPKDSQMRTGLDIMEAEFPDPGRTETFRLMFEGLDEAGKQRAMERVLACEGVDSVTYDPDSPEHNSGSYALFLVNTVYTDEKRTDALQKTVVEELEDEYTVWSYYRSTYDAVLPVLLPTAMVIFLLVLILLSRSYIEVVLLLTSIGVSILLNMGTNIIFESISDMTRSIAAVLQLVLSIDYSIMLFHRYDQEKARLSEPDNVQAMKNAVRNAFSSVSASAVTTIIGLMALLLLSFTIGRDMGLVLAKGILCSLICVFTVMPTMVLWCDGLLETTSKARLRAARRARREAKGHA